MRSRRAAFIIATTVKGVWFARVRQRDFKTDIGVSLFLNATVWRFTRTVSGDRRLYTKR